MKLGILMVIVGILLIGGVMAFSLNDKTEISPCPDCKGNCNSANCGALNGEPCNCIESCGCSTGSSCEVNGCAAVETTSCGCGRS